MQSAARQRKESMEEMEQEEMKQEEMKAPAKGIDNLGEMLEKMQIDVVGKETGNNSDNFVSDEDESDEELDQDNMF